MPDGTTFASLSIRQPSGGYRYSIDAVLLADFAASFCGELILDLGTGSGVVLLLLSRMCPSLRHGFGVEIQRPLYECARRNIGGTDLPGFEPHSVLTNLSAAEFMQ